MCCGIAAHKTPCADLIYHLLWSDLRLCCARNFCAVYAVWKITNCQFHKHMYRTQQPSFDNTDYVNFRLCVHNSGTETHCILILIVGRVHMGLLQLGVNVALTIIISCANLTMPGAYNGVSNNSG